MKTRTITMGHIPAVLWGEDCSKIIIAVHGTMSSKTDIPIAILAEEAVPLGFLVLSFDLPGHGDRKDDPTLFKVQECIPELKEVMDFARTQADTVSLMANSLGAYFSLLAYKDQALKQCLFLSPVVDMKRIIENMMTWFDVSEERLFKEQEIPTPVGQTLYWDYYEYVKNNPVEVWDKPTAILYGKKDELCEYEYVSGFAERFQCKLEVSDSSEHYFHTKEDLEIYRNWIRSNIVM